MPPRTGVKRKRTETNLDRWKAKLRSKITARRNNIVYAPRQVRLGRGPVPPSIRVTLRYNADYGSTGAALDRVFNLNDIFDPEATGGGHQPLGRDQYATLYNRYRVWNCRAKISTAMTIATTPARVTIVADNQPGAYTDASNASEQQGASTHIVQIGAPLVLWRSFSCPKISGVSDSDYKDDRFQSLMTTSPTERICLHIVDSSINGVAMALNDMRYIVTLDYDVELFDPIPLAQS